MIYDLRDRADMAKLRAGVIHCTNRHDYFTLLFTVYIIVVFSSCDFAVRHEVAIALLWL